jgi:peptidoglycan hydrolase CwlO-like protein
VISEDYKKKQKQLEQTQQERETTENLLVEHVVPLDKDIEQLENRTGLYSKMIS